MKKKTKISPTLREAERLHALGLAVHFLHPRSKRPIGNGWTTGPRKSWDVLKSEFHPDYNIGVRLGTASKISGDFLCVVDVDVKSTQRRHRKEALRAVKTLLRGKVCPEVRSGRGNGSRHYYCVTEKPFKTFNAAESSEMVKVMMPSKSPSQAEKEKLSESEIKKGWRLSRAWEVSLYSEGRQVVVPPSIHPDSGEPYKWFSPLTKTKQLPLVEFAPPKPNENKTSLKKGKRRNHEDRTETDEKEFKIVLDETIDVRWLPDLSEKTRKLIVHGVVRGEKITDRSAYLLPATSGLISAGLNANEVLSVLTDKSTYLGECAFDHAQTTNRLRAAKWLYNYTVKRVVKERDPREAFRGVVVEEARELGKKESARQEAELEEKDGGWKSGLDRTDKGQIRSSLKNIDLLLSNLVGKDVFKRNDFSARINYGCNAPWGGKKEAALKEMDEILIKRWLSEEHGIEPQTALVWEAVQLIAHRNSFHPVRDLINSVEWDGVPRIETALKTYLGAQMPEPYLTAISTKFFCAMVARIFQPGVKFDHMLVLEGTQGIGKSSAAEILASPAWFLDALPNIHDKDAMLALQGIWVVEISELAVLKRAEAESYKAFFASKTDKFRVPYGKRWEDEPRQCVFVGTTNNGDYLTDKTGNRRFWPCKIQKCNFKALRRDRLQLLAEAKIFWREFGEKLWLDEDKTKLQAERIQASRMVDDEETVMLDEMESFVKNMHLKSEKEKLDLNRFRIAQLFELNGPYGNYKRDTFHLMLAGRVLRQLRFEKYKAMGKSIWRQEFKAGIPPVATSKTVDTSKKVVKK